MFFRIDNKSPPPSILGEWFKNTHRKGFPHDFQKNGEQMVNFGKIGMNK